MTARTIEIALDERVAPRLQIEHAQLDTQIAALLGSPVQVSVSANASDLPIVVSLDGQECVYPADTIGRVLCFIRGVPQAPEPPAQLNELNDEELNAAVSLLVGFAVNLHLSPIVNNSNLGFEAPTTLDIEISPLYLREVSGDFDPSGGAFGSLRDGLFYELGIRVPRVRLVPNTSLPDDAFRVVIGSVPTLPYRGLRAEQRLVNITASNAGESVKARRAVNPANGIETSIVDKDEMYSLSSATTVWDPVGYMVLACAGEIFRNAERFIDAAVVERELDGLQNAYPELVKQARNKLSPELIAATLRFLLDEEISIRDFPRILQALLDFDFVRADNSRFIVFDSRLSLLRPTDREWNNDPETLAAAVRIALRRYISDKCAHGQSTINVYLIDPGLEQRLTEHDGTVHGVLLRSLRETLGYGPNVGANGPSLLTHADARFALRRAIAATYPRVHVLSYQELVPDTSLQSLGRIEEVYV